MFRPMTPTRLTTDVAIAAACFLLRSAIGYENVAMLVVVLAMAGALAIRRLSPGLALAVAWFGVVVQLLALLIPDPANLAILPVLYATARYGGPTAKWLGLASAGVGAFVASIYLMIRGVLGLTFGIGPGMLWGAAPQSVVALFAFLFGCIAAFGLSWTLGLLAKTWRNARDSRRSQVAAERTVVVEQERNRIARDMHDVVAHSLAVVIAQADGARYAREKDPGAVDVALTTISATAREALADVRLLLGQLRHSQEAGPQPVLADLERLFDQLRASGLVITVETAGEPLVLPPAQQLAVYRIVQEALTNALRHGHTGQGVVVRLDWARDAVELTITNAIGLAAPAAEHPGHGIAGMRERALLVGGTLTAAAADSRFVVRAAIPAHQGVAA